MSEGDSEPSVDVMSREEESVTETQSISEEQGETASSTFDITPTSGVPSTSDATPTSGVPSTSNAAHSSNTLPTSDASSDEQILSLWNEFYNDTYWQSVFGVCSSIRGLCPPS